MPCELLRSPSSEQECTFYVGEMAAAFAAPIQPPCHLYLIDSLSDWNCPGWALQGMDAAVEKERIMKLLLSSIPIDACLRSRVSRHEALSISQFACTFMFIYPCYFIQ